MGAWGSSKEELLSTLWSSSTSSNKPYDLPQHLQSKPVKGPQWTLSGSYQPYDKRTKRRVLALSCELRTGACHAGKDRKVVPWLIAGSAGSKYGFGFPKPYPKWYLGPDILHSPKFTWKWRRGHYKATMLYIGPSMSFHVNLGEGTYSVLGHSEWCFWSRILAGGELPQRGGLTEADVEPKTVASLLQSPCREGILQVASLPYHSHEVLVSCRSLMEAARKLPISELPSLRMITNLWKLSSLRSGQSQTSFSGVPSGEKRTRILLVDTQKSNSFKLLLRTTSKQTEAQTCEPWCLFLATTIGTTVLSLPQEV